MLVMLQDLMRHKAWANASLLRAIHAHDAAARDTDMRTLLHHILIANTFWYLRSRGRPFKPDRRVPESFGEIIAQYRELHSEELQWVEQIREPELDRLTETPQLPGQSFSVAQAMVQVCLHSQGHRAQCATMLRALGGAPTGTDFVIWLKERPAAEWP
jgi:uncharacterized damage-inducible protein DinB